MNRAWSEMLVDLPIWWDLGLRITTVLGLAWMLHAALHAVTPRWQCAIVAIYSDCGSLRLAGYAAAQSFRRITSRR